MDHHQHDDSAGHLGLLDHLPADLLASQIWLQLPRLDRRRLRQCCSGMAQYAASELMMTLQVLVCRASLLHVTSSGRSLHQRFPRPASVVLRLLPPARRDEAGAGPTTSAAAAAAAGDTGGAGAEGWYGSTAVMSYFLSELGVATSVTSLSLQGWQELSPRDLHHVTTCYPRLARLHLAGLPYNNYLSGSSLEPLGRCAPWLRELVIDTQVVMDVQSALAALSRLPRLASLELSGLPLLGSLDLPLHPLTGLTRLALTFEHKHTHSEQQLAALAALSGLRHLALDFMQLGSGSSLWSAGWLLSHVISRLTSLTTLRLPRAFLDDKSHPEFLCTLASLPYLTDLALGYVILSPETVAAAAKAAVATGTAAPSATAAAATDGDGIAGISRSPRAGPARAETFTASVDGGGEVAEQRDRNPEADEIEEVGCSSGRYKSRSASSGSFPEGQEGSSAAAAAATTAAAAATLLRPWRRLALGAAMPCYLECLLPALGAIPAPVVSELGAIPVPVVSEPARPSAAAAAVAPPGPPMTQDAQAAERRAPGDSYREGSLEGQGTDARQQQRQLSPWLLPGSSCAVCCCCGDDVGAGGGTGSNGGGAGLELLELSTPSTLPMVQLLPQFVRRGGCFCRGGGGGGGVREVRMLLRLASNWREVAAALAAVGPALTSLALMPTYLYGSGTMMTSQVLSSMVAALTHLTHLELYRLNIEPRDVSPLADMPHLRYGLLGVAEEARERRGHGHPAALVTELLAALHARQRRCRRWDSKPCRDPRQAWVPLASAAAATAAAGGRTAAAGSSATDAWIVPGSSLEGCGDVVVCCPELSEDEVVRMNEKFEVEYNTYGMYGSRLRVESAVDGSLPWRLAVGCSLAPERWRP